jgi:hypothetical protein
MRISLRKILFACLVVGGAVFGITILRSPHSFNEKHLQIEQLEKENEVMIHKITDKKNYLERLQQNPDELSLEIKRRLLLVNPGSKSFILQDGTKHAPQPESGTGR